MPQPLTAQFIEGLYYAICQKQATSNETASILAHAKTVKDALSIIKKNPKAEVFLGQFNGLSCNWMDNLFCVGEQPSIFQAIMLSYTGINRFVDVTENEQQYLDVLPENVSYYKATIANDSRNKPEAVELAARSILEPLAKQERVYLHCQSGFCRSAIIASIVMAVRLNMSYSDAMKTVKLRRPVAQPQLDLFVTKDATALIEKLKAPT